VAVAGGEDARMRLVMAGGTRNVSVWLEAETLEETAALQTCAARGEWTNGRGTEAIAKLRALAERLGYPVRDPNRLARPAPPCLVVVRHGERDLYERLTTIARDSVTVVWDRRKGERRKADRPAAADRRRQDRRQLPPPTWALGFLVVQFEDAPP
jgi:hypothetical protein